MKTLFLIRHAHSGRRSGIAEDVKRPLSERGKAEASEMGKRLKTRLETGIKNKGVKIDAFYSSVAKRAYETAEIVAKETGFPVENIIRDEAFYTFNDENLLQAVRSINGEFSTVAVFCHNFAISGVASLFAGREMGIPTCGVVHIKTGAEKWAKIPGKEGKVVEFDFPGRG